MFKVILLVLAVLFSIYGMAELMGIVPKLSTYSDVIALLLASLFMVVRSLIVNGNPEPMAIRNK